jgi:Uma2 family endonuclease
MTYAEYEALGETKYAEFYDGMVTVNPPTRRHVVINRRLTLLLGQALPPEYEVLPEAGWLAAPEVVFIPDLMVVRLDAPGEDVIRSAPLLVVEITSRSTRSEDLGYKMAAYAEGGADWYWIVDPEKSTLTTYQRGAHRCTQHSCVHRWEMADIQQPLVVAIDVTELFK